MFKVVVVFFVLFSVKLYASELPTLFCPHIQVCNTLLFLLDEPMHLVAPDFTNKDPHTFEPSPMDLKKLYQADIAVLGPSNLHPWMNPLIEKKLIKNKKEFHYTIPSMYFRIYNSNDRHILSHFWLYPQILCDYQNALRSFLIKSNLKVKTNKCDPQFDFKVRHIIKNKGIILTHNALEPLLNYLGARTFSLRGSHHHDHTSPHQLKELKNTLEKEGKRSVIWLIEEQIPMPPVAKRWIRSHDIVIPISVLGSKDTEPDQVIKTILKTLEERLNEKQ